MKSQTVFAALLLPTLFAAGAIAQQSVPMRPIAPQNTVQVPAQPPLLDAGTVAPDFAAQDMAGKLVHLSDFKDKVVVLDFWATWCGPCMASLPHTQEVAKKYKDAGVTVLAVCTSDTRAAYEKWMPENQPKYSSINFVCELNDKGSANFDDRASKKLYSVSGIPTQYIIGKDGKIVDSLLGYRPGETRLEESLAKAGVKETAK